MCYILTPVAVVSSQLVDSTWARIRPLAAQDNTIWKQGDGSRGYAQITTEFIPIRAKQLLQVRVSGQEDCVQKLFELGVGTV